MPVTAKTPPGQAAEKTLRRRPQMRKYTGLQMRQFPDGQQAPPVEVSPGNYGAEKGPYGWRGESAGFVPHQQYEIPNPKQQHANLGPPEQRVLYSNNAPQQIPAPPQHMPAALQQIPVLPQQIPLPPQHVPVPPQHAPASPQHIPASLGYSYAGYIERQAKRYPIMMYTLVQCVPCQKAKHLLAVSYADVAAHFLEFAGHEDWHRQLAVDLIRITGQETFPYIFVCGQNVPQTCSNFIKADS
ncbi:hypothetical protein NECAME_14645 [Necator americanus]|uniref:Glutaredoxin domain-containing protein n=1 Tax=Necator americanus TaxID=51031 RepID=W2SP19_NECAM|nr:hypothetical protein NECAME_14645 [Necator americanus]ETN70621.1 hypothetical protein NECAME_14645 [Necator americanus]